MMSWLATRSRSRTRKPYQGRTYLYRLYGSHGRLLYIGISNSPTIRFAQHAADPKKRHWWHAVDMGKTTLRTFETRNRALRAEELAIKTEGPLHNKVHNPAWGGTYVGERPTDRIARPVIVSVICVGFLLGAWSGAWTIPTGPQVALGFVAFFAARLAWLRR